MKNRLTTGWKIAIGIALCIAVYLLAIELNWIDNTTNSEPVISDSIDSSVEE